MKTPKQRFVESTRIAEAHKDTVDSSQFLLAMDMALLQIVSELKSTSDVQAAAANYWKLEGALSYMKTLSQLGDAPPSRNALPDDNLIRTK